MIRFIGLSIIKFSNISLKFDLLANNKSIIGQLYGQLGLAFNGNCKVCQELVRDAYACILYQLLKKQ